MDISLTTLHGCILIFHYLLQAFLQNNSHGFYIHYNAFEAYFRFYTNENNLNNKSLHYDLMLFL